MTELVHIVDDLTSSPDVGFAGIDGSSSRAEQKRRALKELKRSQVL